MKIYDLSQPLNEQFPFWPYYPPFEVKYIKRKAEHGVNAQYIMTSNHMGTHLDAPRHFVTNGRTIDEIPVEWLCGPGVIVNLSDEMDELDLYTPKMIEDRAEVRKGRPAVPAHRLAQVRAVRRQSRRREIHSPPSRRPSRSRAVAAREGNPHLGSRLRVDRSPDEPADRPLPRQGAARPLRSRPQSRLKKSSAARKRSTSCSPTPHIS